MVSSSGPFTLMKLAWHSFAIALASSVFPQPAPSPHTLTAVTWLHQCTAPLRKIMTAFDSNRLGQQRLAAACRPPIKRP